MKNKKFLLLAGVVFLVVILMALSCVFMSKDNEDNVKLSDNERFSKEYTLVTNDNVFVYRDAKEIINILKNGTGIVYLGFPECPWCQEYVSYLNDVVKDNNIEKIYYCNILKDRKNNTKEYQEIVNILEEYLQFDDEGNKRIFVPAVIMVSNGEIVGFDDETAWDTKGCETPDEYWCADSVSSLKNRLNDYVSKISSTMCSSCNKN